MLDKAHPVRSTIFYGFAAAVLFAPAVIVMAKFLAWPLAFRLAVWIIVLGYSCLLASWSSEEISQIIFSQLILLVLALSSNSIMFFLVLAILILGWVRQRCFMKSTLKGMLIETIVSGSTVVLILFFQAHSIVSFAINIWLFFLVQSFYFVIVSPGEAKAAMASVDRFSRASRQAEEILSS